MKKPGQAIWSVRIALHDVPESGRHFDLVADDRVRTEVARRAGLRSLTRFKATFDVRRHGREGLRVTGQVSATVGQTCVVTLELIENAIEETVDLVFTPTVAPAAAAVDDGTVLASGVPVPADTPEPMIEGAIDLGAIATEFLLLGIDPYPRKPGTVFEAPAADADDAGAHPFAALAALKKAPGGKDR